VTWLNFPNLPGTRPESPPGILLAYEKSIPQEGNLLSLEGKNLLSLEGKHD
jgi:hypothetical protein